jgi:hypothetical protein
MELGMTRRRMDIHEGQSTHFLTECLYLSMVGVWLQDT